MQMQLTFLPHPSICGNNEFSGTSLEKKTNFRFMKKRINFRFFSLHSFIVMFFVDMSEFSLLLFYEEKIKVGFSAYSISNENLTSYK